MNTIFFLLLFISYSYSYIDDETLNKLQVLDHWNTFRIIVSHTDDECFYVDAKLNDTLHVIYQVLKGGDYYITATIKNPFGEILFTQGETAFGWYEEKRTEIPGVYELCFRNERYFTTKYLYIGVLSVHRKEMYESVAKAILTERNNETVLVDEFSRKAMKVLNQMSSTLYQITAYQTVARVHHVHDLFSAQSNINYVQKWALYQIVLMILCSIIQVFCIRRLFKSVVPTKKSKSNSIQPNFQNNNNFFIIN